MIVFLNNRIFRPGIFGAVFLILLITCAIYLLLHNFMWIASFLFLAAAVFFFTTGGQDSWKFSQEKDSPCSGEVGRLLLECGFSPPVATDRLLEYIIHEFGFVAGTLVFVDARHIPRSLFLATVRKNEQPVLEDPLKDEMILDAIITGTPLTISRFSQDLPARFLEEHLKGAASRRLVPIRVSSGEVIGILDVYSDGNIPEAFENFLSSVFFRYTNLFSYWVDAARTAEERGHLSVINQIYQEINSTINLDRLLKLIVMHARRLIPAELCHVFLANEEKNELTLKLISSDDDGFFRQVKFRKGEGVAGWVFEHGRGVLIDDVAQDPRFVEKEWSPVKIVSMLCVPLVAQNETIGVISMTSPEKAAFQARDYDILEKLAATVSMAIYNTRLFEKSQKKVKELSTLYNVSKTIASAFNLEKVLRIIIEQATRILNADIGGILLVNPMTEELEIKASYGLSLSAQQKTRYRKGESIVGYVLETGKPVLTPDVSNDPRFTFKDTLGVNVKSDITVPLKVGDKVIGVLTLGNGPGKPAYSEEDLNLLISIASQAAIAIRNTELYEKSEQKVRELSTLYEVSRVLSSTLNLENVLNVALKMINQVLGARRSSIIILSRDGKSVNTRVSQGLPGDILASISLDDGNSVIAEVIRTKKPLLVRDIREEAFAAGYNPERYDTYSFISVPLVIKDQLIGVINVTDKTSGYPFNEEDLLLLTTLANQIAADVENARLYEMAVTDGLTEVYNHKYFQQRLEEDLERAKRYKEDLSLLMIDIDYFKEFNDRFGHQTGDRILVKAAQVIKSSVREVDLLARYGGEEFAVILPVTTKQRALEISERMRKKFEETLFLEEHPEARITVSIGVASFPEDAAMQWELIKKADQALYCAKEGGRNRVSAWRRL